MLNASKVPRALESKTKLFGFELGDVLAVFLYLSTSNFIFGHTRLKALMVWGGTALIAALVYFVKRNKPDGYLQHWGEFKRTPGILSAGIPDTEYTPYIDRTANQEE